MSINHLLTCKERKWNGLVGFEQKLLLVVVEVFNLSQQLHLKSFLVESTSQSFTCRKYPQLLRSIHTFFLRESMLCLSHVLWTRPHLDILAPLIELLARLPFSLIYCTRPLIWQGAEPGGSSYEKLWPFFCGAIKWGCLGPWLWIINSSPQ